MPRLVMLDWGHTLSHSLFWSQWVEPVHPLHSVRASAKRLLFSGDRELSLEWMRGHLDAETICEMIAQDCGVTRGLVLDGLNASCQNMELCSDRVPELVQKIRKQGTRVVIATDNMDVFRRWTIPAMHLKEWLDDFLISCELGVLKSDCLYGRLLFFAPFFQANNLSYSDAVLLDDSGDPTGMFERAGLRVIPIKSTEMLLHELGALAVCAQ